MELGPSSPFDWDWLVRHAKNLASQPFAEVPTIAPEIIDQIDYGPHQDIVQPIETGLYTNGPGECPVTFFHLGRLFPKPVRMYSLVNGTSDSAYGGGGSQVTLNGNSDIASVGDWSSVTFNGSGDQAWTGYGSTVVENGGSDTVTTGDSSNLTINGSGDVGYLGNYSGATVNGTSNTVVSGMYSYIVVPGVFNSIGVGAGSAVVANLYNYVW